MRIDFNSIKPIYIQVAEIIEDDIISGKLNEGDPVYSQLVLSKELGINPATAAKGIKQLVAEGILEKQRGLSMVVLGRAKEQLLKKRRDKEFKTMAEELVVEALKIGLKKNDVISKITKLFKSAERGDPDD